MAGSSGFDIRAAVPGLDDDAVVRLMTEYMTWAHERLATEFGVHDPPHISRLVGRRHGYSS
jgi:hypothetical protein